MAAHSIQPSAPADLGKHISGRWVIAGLLGITVACMLTIKNPWPSLRPVPIVLIAVACGWIVLIIFAPWASMRSMHADKMVIRRLAGNLRNITAGDRDVTLDELAPRRDDEIGELGRLLRALAAEVLDARRQARWLRKHMGDNVRRETDRATVMLTRQAQTDPLTGLGNRRALEQRLDDALHADAMDAFMTVMAVDLDLFKTVNDALGHEVGDECLIFLANLLRSSVRAHDCAIRLGGDEFVVLLPGLDVEQARPIADRLGILYAQMPWPHRRVPQPTLSIGLASGEISALADPMDLVRQADAALYQSKRNGRATVTLATSVRHAA